MKIKSQVPPKPDKATFFTNGHLYRPLNPRSPNEIYLYACGFLIDIVTGKQMNNVQGRDPERYEDVTDDYTLVQNTLLEEE